MARHETRSARRREILPRFIAQSKLVTSVVAGLGTVGLVAAGFLGGTAGAIVASIAGAVLTAAFVSVLYDAFLKQSLLGDIFDAVQVRDSVQRFGLQDMLTAREASLGTLLDGANEAVVVPVHPADWAAHDFPELRRYAASHALRATVLLPAGDSPHVDVWADRLEASVEEFRGQMDGLALSLGREWTNGRPYVGSSLSVVRFSALPGYGVVLTDKVLALELSPLLRMPALDRTAYTVLFERDVGPLGAWFARQLERANVPGWTHFDQWPRTTAAALDPHHPTPEATETD